MSMNNLWYDIDVDRMRKYGDAKMQECEDMGVNTARVPDGRPYRLEKKERELQYYADIHYGARVVLYL